jgi:hypothetical protein
MPSWTNETNLVEVMREVESMHKSSGFWDLSNETKLEIVSKLEDIAKNGPKNSTLGICGNLHGFRIKGVTLWHIIGMTGYFQGSWEHSTFKSAYPVPVVNKEGLWSGRHLEYRKDFIKHLIECLGKELSHEQ